MYLSVYEGIGMKQYANVTVREARGADTVAIAARYRSFVSSPHIDVREDRLETIASDPNNFLFVCEADEVVCGTALLTLCLDAMFGNQPYGVLENVVVNEAWRGKGIGRRLFEHAEEMCRIRDCSKIMLVSTTTRESAHRFFEKQGFSSASKRGFVKYRSQFRHSPGITAQPDKSMEQSIQENT
jgi:N-acetylglutamate synthase-like GNAT family acetyltransferase